MTLLSVIIPSYNRACFLMAAVDSVLAQNCEACEIVIVDDGSTDETEHMVQARMPAWGDKVRYIRQENGERCIARNNGLRAARGEFIAFLDSDDVWRAGHVASCLEALRRNPHAVAAYGEYGLLSEDGYPIRQVVRRPIASGRTFQRCLCLKTLIIHPTEVVIRRSAIQESEPFDPEIPGGEDWLLWVRLVRRGSFVPTRRPTVWMRSHAGGTFGDPWKFSRSMMLAAEKVANTGLPASVGIAASRVLAINHVHCGYAHFLNENRLQASWHLASAIRADPFAVFEPDFWKVSMRLSIGRRLVKRLRSLRQRPRTAFPEALGQACAFTP